MNEELISFPCDFPIKVLGRSDAEFHALVVGLVEPLVGALPTERVTSRESREGNFVALTLHLRVESRAQLDDVYRILSGHEQVLMVL
jgi:hypothetical protein